MAGHQGYEMTLTRVCSKTYWIGMAKDIFIIAKHAKCAKNLNTTYPLLIPSSTLQSEDKLLFVVWNIDPTYSEQREAISDCSNVHNFTMRCYLIIGSLT